MNNQSESDQMDASSGKPPTNTFIESLDEILISAFADQDVSNNQKRVIVHTAITSLVEGLIGEDEQDERYDEQTGWTNSLDTEVRNSYRESLRKQIRE